MLTNSYELPSREYRQWLAKEDARFGDGKHTCEWCRRRVKDIRRHKRTRRCRAERAKREMQSQGLMRGSTAMRFARWAIVAPTEVDAQGRKTFIQTWIDRRIVKLVNTLNLLDLPNEVINQQVDDYAAELDRMISWDIRIGGMEWNRSGYLDIDFDTMQCLFVEPDTDFDPQEDA